ncbi:MAG: hypothetical protein KAU01_07805 [Candidatus Cloacimonetes bacterium]|nr:hypothetical protein [Candidatus Cloacimonadota bacterium]
MRIFQTFCTIAFLVILLILGCSKNHPASYNGNTNDLITISFTDEKVINENNMQEYTYTQGITWKALIEDEPLFAYRITTSDGELPEGFSIDPDGWVYQNEPEEESTIWTDETELEISFNSINGVLKHIITEFEVKFLLDTQESEIVSASFFDFREIGTVLTTTGGDCNGHTTGTGLTFLISEKILDIFVDGLYADHFMYRLNIISEIDSTLISEGEWFNTINCEDIRRVELNGYTTPPLVPNEDGELTQFETYIVTRSGFADEDNPAIANFKVQEGFYPNTVIYNGLEQNGVNTGNDTWALGENHFITYIEPCLSIMLPYVVTEEGYHFATAFWIDKNGDYVLIGSEDLQIYLHLGWVGEYAYNNPFHDVINYVIDELTGQPYFSEIIYFDLRLDGESFEYSSLPASEYNITDNNGTEWLRVPIEHEIAQHTTLTGLSYGEHTFTARAVDLQLAVDETPAEFTFMVFEPIPSDEKEGIIILDDTPDHSMFSPEVLIDELYLEFLSDYYGPIECLDRNELQNTVWIPTLHFSKDVFSPTDIQSYELVIYHSDSPTLDSKFALEYDVINIYLNQGGNLVFSGGVNLMFVQNDCCNFNFPLLEKYFGIPLSDINAIDIVRFEEFNTLVPPFFHLQFFVKALAEDGFVENIDLQIPSFNPFVNFQPILQDTVNALGPVALFENYDSATEEIFGFGCRQPEAGTSFTQWDDIDDEDHYPSENQFNIYNGKSVALRKITEKNKCYIFGFPLAYMEPDDVRAMLNQIIAEIE